MREQTVTDNVAIGFKNLMIRNQNVIRFYIIGIELNHVLFNNVKLFSNDGHGTKTKFYVE